MLEGSATVAMIDYLLRDTGKSSRDIPDLDPSLLLGNVNDSPELSSAPIVIQDEMLFPYVAGSSFTQHVLKASGGWAGLHRLFDNPPVSTQQILHPDLYLQNVMPQAVNLAPVLKVVPRGWKKLDENNVGELFWHVILKQYIGADRADELSPGWAGDRYDLVSLGGKSDALVWATAWDTPIDAAEFVDALDTALPARYKGLQQRSHGTDRRRFEGGGRTVEVDAVTVDGHPVVLLTDVPAGVSPDLVDPARIRIAH